MHFLRYSGCKFHMRIPLEPVRASTRLHIHIRRAIRRGNGHRLARLDEKSPFREHLNLSSSLGSTLPKELAPLRRFRGCESKFPGSQPRAYPPLSVETNEPPS